MGFPVFFLYRYLAPGALPPLPSAPVSGFDKRAESLTWDRTAFHRRPALLLNVCDALR